MVMNSLQITSNDLVMVNNKFVRIMDTGDALVQQITHQVKIWLGEWFADSSIGIDYLGFENKRYSDKEIIDSIRQSLLVKPNIKGINKIEVSRDNATRRLSITIDVETTQGNAVITI